MCDVSVVSTQGIARTCFVSILATLQKSQMAACRESKVRAQEERNALPMERP
jgi:hypothetical protein